MKNAILVLLFLIAVVLTILQFHIYRTDRKRSTLYLGIFSVACTILIVITLVNYWTRT